MDYNIDGICLHCSRATPVSVNTIQENGVVCLDCRIRAPARQELQALKLKRISALEEELGRLKASLRRAPA